MDGAFLWVARLTDPPVTAGHPNCSLSRLVQALPDGTDPVFRQRAADLLANVDAKAKPIRDHRMKRLAHLDLSHALGSADPLPSLNAPAIDSCLDSIRSLMNAIVLYFGGTMTMYEEPVQPGGGDSLLHVVKCARRLHALRHDALFAKLPADELLAKIKRP